jgi:hypothetical protein
MRIRKPTEGIASVQANDNRTLKWFHDQTAKFAQTEFPCSQEPLTAESLQLRNHYNCGIITTAESLQLRNHYKG